MFVHAENLADHKSRKRVTLYVAFRGASFNSYAEKFFRATRV